MHTTSSDITERGLAEKALLESQDKLALAMRAANMGSWLFDLNTGRFEADALARQLHGLGVDEDVATFARADRNVHPDDGPANKRKIQEAIETGGTFKDEYRVIWPKGDIRWVAAEGKVIGKYLIGVVRDVTDRKRADQERERLLAELRAAEAQRNIDLDAMIRLHRLASSWLKETNIEPILGEAVDAAIAISGADFGNIQILDAATSSLRITAHRGLPGWWLEFWDSVREGQGVCGAALERKERLIVEDVEKSPLFEGAALDAQRRAGIRAVQSTPLIGRSGTPLGMFSTHYKTPRRPDENTLRLLDLLGRQAADIIEGARAIAESQRAADAAREAEERFRALVNASAQIVWTTDPDGTVVEDSPSWRAFTGQTYEQWKGFGWTNVLHPEDRERTAALWSDAVKAKTPIVSEHRLRHVSGEWRWTSARAVPLLQPDGSVKKWVGMNTDITARKHAEEALRESETEQQFIAQVATILASTINYEETLSRVAELVVRDLADCCIIDLVEEDGRVRRPKVVHRDPKMASAIYILQRIDLDSKRPHLASAVLEHKKPLLIAQVTAVYLASVAQSDEHRDALGKLAPKSLIAIPLMECEQVLGALLFIRTSSNEPYKPSDLRLAEELGRRAALAVHHARLYRAAQRATEARDQVLGIVAHDLRNPLNTIVMQAALLQRGRPEGERRSRRPGESIQRAAVRMNRLIQDLLEVTRIEAGQFSVERSRVAVEQVALDATEAQKALVSSAGLDLRLDVARDLPEISGDHSRLVQVFENLIGNAVKFTPSGGRITIGAAPRDGEMLFWVENTGAGIPAEHLPHVFDRFWQARKGEHSGAGLGLSIVEGIVEAHGGRVWVESTTGRGTTFYFTVPVASGGEESEPAVLH